MTDNFQLETNKHLSQCQPKDVISFESEKWIGFGKLKNIISRAFNERGLNSIRNCISDISYFKDSNIWFEQGENCEILRAGSQEWQKGKFKINVTLEFIPDEPEKIESPLDDIRQAEINNIE